MQHQPPQHPRQRLHRLCARILDNDALMTRVEVDFLLYLEESDAHVLARALSSKNKNHGDHLKELNLSDIGINGSKMKILFGCPNSMRNLTRLDLSFNPIRDDGATLLRSWLRGDSSNTASDACYSTVESLFLHDAQLFDDGLAMLAQQPCSFLKLRHLGLSKNHITAHGGQALKHILKSNPWLRRLDLVDNRLGVNGIMALVEDGLPPLLEVLDLAGNKIGFGGTAALCEALIQRHHASALGASASSPMRQLNLMNNQLGDEGTRSLAQALSVGIRIEKIFLDRNEIGDGGALDLAATLSGKNGSLEYLSLNRNQIGSTGAVALGEMLSYNTYLKKLHLVRNRVGANGGKEILAALKFSNVTLEAMELTGNNVTTGTLLREIRFWARLNASGRRALQDPSFPSNLWHALLARVKNQPDAMFYFLRQAPELFNSAVNR